MNLSQDNAKFLIAFIFQVQASCSRARHRVRLGLLTRLAAAASTWERWYETPSRPSSSSSSPSLTPRLLLNGGSLQTAPPPPPPASLAPTGSWCLTLAGRSTSSSPTWTGRGLGGTTPCSGPTPPTSRSFSRRCPTEPSSPSCGSSFPTRQRSPLLS